VTTGFPSLVKLERVRTIAALWREALASPPSTPLYLVERDDTWQAVSWAEAARAVDELANGLLALGVRKGDAFAILARTSLEWALFDFALGHVGAVGVGIYPVSSARDTAYILRHSEAVGVLVEDEEHLAKVAGARSELPRLEHVLTYDDLDELRERGRAFAEANPTALDDAVAAIGEDDLFTFIYTSGTTGPPKACMIRHRNYYEMVRSFADIESLIEPDDVMLLYLPLAHNYGRLLHLGAPYARYTLAFLPDPLRAAEALPAVRPTIFPSVPRVYEKIHSAVIARLDSETGLKRRLGSWSLGVGRRVSGLEQRQKAIPSLLALKHRVADRLLFSKIKQRFGGRLRIANSGGAPLSAEIAEFFHALGITIYEGYGLSECTTACTVNRPGAVKFGTVGQPLPRVEVKLAGDGELLVRSPTVFAGYYNDPEATREVLTEDGWLRTGDIAQIDEDGFVTITDRKKDILVTAGGKNVAPQNLENELKTSKYVSQALVVGDRRPYVAALITLEQDELEKWRAAGGNDTHALIQRVVDDVNTNHSRHEQIKRFAILPRDFSADEGEITPTLKLKRRVCQEHFAREIERLYS
jgi:long-chain acyl-CoA synthetase